MSTVALGVFVAVGLFAYGAPLLSAFVTGQSYAQQDLTATFAPPGAAETIAVGGLGTAGVRHVTIHHWLGTDDLGRDVLTRLAYGGRVSLTVAVLALTVTLTIGTVVGAVAGFYGRWVDAVLMRAADVVLSVPALFTLILLSTIVDNDQLLTRTAFYRASGWLVVPVVIAVLAWPTLARLIRGQFLAMRRRPYVEAARALGASDGRLILRHILPNVAPVIIVWGTHIIPELILIETALSYLGFGVQVPIPSWGNMLSNATASFTLAPSLVVLPGLMIFLTAMSVNVVGNGLRDAIDPRLR